MEEVQVNIGVVRARAAQSHVCGVLWERLHGRNTGALSVTVGVAGIERTVMVEH